MKKLRVFLFLTFIFMLALSSKGQQADSVKMKPYDYLSSYYNDGNFHPFQKGTWYIGLAFSLEDVQSINSEKLTVDILDGNNQNFNILLKGGFYTQDYNMIGMNFNYYQQSFNGTVFQDPDTVQSNSLTRGYVFTPNLRSSIPLTKNERFSFFVALDLSGGFETTLTRNTKNVDEISETYTKSYLFGAAIAPGITFFAMENFAFEIQLRVLDYQLNITDSTVDGDVQSRVTQNNLDLKIDLLTLQLGLAYYVGRKSK